MLNIAPPSSQNIEGAIIFCAGMGTRFKPWTDHHPKALAIVNGKSLLQRNVEYLQSFGIRNVVVNVHHFADQIAEAIEKNHGWGSNIYISDETEAVLETGGGLLKAKFFLENFNAFVALNVDILTNLPLQKFIQFHLESNPLVSLAVSDRESSRVLLFNNDMELCGWQNSKTDEVKISKIAEATHQKAFSGISIYSNEIFKHINLEGKFSVVDLWLNIANEHSIFGYDYSGGLWVDVGRLESVIKAEKLFI